MNMTCDTERLRQKIRQAEEAMARFKSKLEKPPVAEAKTYEQWMDPRQNLVDALLDGAITYDPVTLKGEHKPLGIKK